MKIEEGWSVSLSFNTWRMLGESDTDGEKCCKNVASEMKVAGVVRSLVNDMSLKLEWARHAFSNS